MRFSEVSHSDTIPYSIAKIDGCLNVTLGFSFLQSEKEVGARRYCNKVLVHECVSIPSIDALDIIGVNFIAYDDACYENKIFDKSVESTEIELQLNDEDLVIGVLISFTEDETCCLPPRLAYKLIGTLSNDSEIILARGNLYITPCSCNEELEEDLYWEEIEW